MPPFRSLGDANIKSLIAYLRVLQGKGGSAKLPGDPDRGASLFFGKARCADCHMAGGKGGFIAADLTTYGAGRMPAEIREDIVAPGRDPDHRAKQAVAVDHQGQKYSGIIRTEDNFSLVLETHSGEFVLLQKADLASLTYVAEPLMPRDYGTTLSPAELDDVVSYLMNLRRKDASSTTLPNAKRHWEDEE